MSYCSKNVLHARNEIAKRLNHKTMDPQFCTTCQLYLSTHQYISLNIIHNLSPCKSKQKCTYLQEYGGSVAECSARRTRNLDRGRGFDSRPSHVAIALGKQFTLTFPSPPTCKMGTQLQAMSL